MCVSNQGPVLWELVVWESVRETQQRAAQAGRGGGDESGATEVAQGSTEGAEGVS